MHNVYINVYSMSDINDYIGCFGVGIYHSGVEVEGMEFSYGGHSFDSAGIFSNRPKQAPGPVLFQRSILVGVTDYSKDEILDILRQMAPNYKGNRYHLLTKNCNTFTDDLVWRLTRQRSPRWINRLAGLAVQVHCCLPRSWVPPLDPPRADNAHVDRMDLSVAPHTALLQPPSLGPNGFSDLEDEHEGLIDRKESFTLRAGMTAAENGAALGMVGAGTGERRRGNPSLPPAPLPLHPPGKAHRYETLS